MSERHWSALDGLATKDGLDLDSAYLSIRNDFRELIVTVLNKASPKFDPNRGLDVDLDVVRTSIDVPPRFESEFASLVAEARVNLRYDAGNDPVNSRVYVAGSVLAVSGYQIPIHAMCVLECRSDNIILNWINGTRFTPIAFEEYPQVLSLQIGGRGQITTGGGFMGGGFGVKGFIEGAAIATALNLITTRTRIETIVHFRSSRGELFLLNRKYTPQQLFMTLSPTITRIETAHQALLQPAAPARDAVAQLQDLNNLRATGSLSGEEFQYLKMNIMKSLNSADTN